MGLDSLQQIQARIARACGQVGRNPAQVRLIGASKGQAVEKILVLARAGLHDFGENYWQELQTKREATLAAEPELAQRLRWHFIGSLQRRKMRKLVGSSILIHSLDSETLAQEIERRICEQKIVALIQVNTGYEDSKSGILPERLEALLKACSPFTHLIVRGLMCLPPYSDNQEDARPHFRLLRELRDEMNRHAVYKEPLAELSMGMSHDFEVAIEEGATMIRVGTALFGERSISPS